MLKTLEVLNIDCFDHIYSLSYLPITENADKRNDYRDPPKTQVSHMATHKLHNK